MKEKNTISRLYMRDITLKDSPIETLAININSDLKKNKGKMIKEG